MEHKSVVTHWIRLYVAGSYEQAKQSCREYCMMHGLCVTVERCDYIYTGGAEDGVVVGLINYPRFPSVPDDIYGHAIQLGERLRLKLCQHSFLVMTPEKTEWFSHRPENNSEITT